MKKRLLSVALAALMTVTSIVGYNSPSVGSVRAAEVSASQAYVEAMGSGWNLGNTFDGFDTDLSKEDLGENAWGNPDVTRELIQAVKEKGYDSIRMPMTVYRRYSETDGVYVVDEDWLARYREVVEMALDEDMYVMINMHHDSWVWLSSWDGNVESSEYKLFVQCWEQIAAAFADISDKVCFETINEPQFQDTGDVTAQDKLDMINLAAYNAIRNSGGKNDTRMIVMPTLNTNHGNCVPLYNLIESLEDENIIATIHYYSEWVFSANLGKTGFDEDLWGNGNYSSRNALDEAFTLAYNNFTNNGIGVVIGEYGLLGYDAGAECNELGEELKYYEYINYVADSMGMCLMFWDNGSGINRLAEDYSWKKEAVGNMLEASMKGRSSYATGLDMIYVNDAVTDIEIPLTLNGNTFTDIEGLTLGTDYTYNEETATVTILKSYVEARLEAMGDEYGVIADLTFRFSSGANWNQQLIKSALPVLEDAQGTNEGITIPADFNGSKIRRAVAYMGGSKVGPHSSWWSYLQYCETYVADYVNNNVTIKASFFNDSSVVDGNIEFVFELYDGRTVSYYLNRSGNVIVGSNEAIVDNSATSTTSQVVVGSDSVITIGSTSGYVQDISVGSTLTIQGHVQSIGWQEEGSSTGIAGKRLEAVRITTSDEASDVFYRAYVEGYGWLAWAKNGEISGTTGMSREITRFQIVMLPKGSQSITTNSVPFKNLVSGVSYSGHVQSYGDMSAVSDGAVLGTVGQAKRLEGFTLTSRISGLSFSISSHIQSYGDRAAVSDGTYVGTKGESKRIEGFTISTSGEQTDNYNVYYRAHVQSNGWSSWLEDGEYAGTKGQSKRVEAIQVVLENNSTQAQ